MDSCVYEIDSISVDIDVLKNAPLDYRWVFDNSIRLRYEHRDIIEYFYKKYTTDRDKLYRYMLNPEWAEASRNMRFRFLIVKVSEDYVFVPLKLVDAIGKSRYFSISMEPVSNNGSTENIIEVLKIFLNSDTVRDVIVPEITPCDEVDNNYYNTLEDFKNMDRSTWRSKRGINKLMDIVRFLPDADERDLVIVDRVHKVNELWDSIKKSKNPREKLNGSTDKRLAELSIGAQSLNIYGFYYNDKLIGYSIACVILDNYVALLSTKQITGDYSILSDYVGEDSDNLKKVYKHLSAYMQYMIQRDILSVKEMESVYNYGDTKIKGLKEFKLDYYKHRFSYNRYSVGDYLDRITTGDRT